ncbi:hypothetical protein PHACT_06385 [Pseudohongiella acticola]|uniref:Peptidase n=1 Tax=Pseudohongiella acticola TaxID=1524254 RepID=A0A1E8CK57_9GAMM|nr:PepSY domain-containing protein [Pseudohongiella acticola]OFE12809.1 hypothetical protein PHACT_06385 [Pseudohongiella acticola]
MRLILIIHRYLAVAVGLLMTLWCLSGFVMMYQSFPELSNEQRLNGLEPLELSACCNLGRFAPHDDTPLGGFRIEMLLGEPVLRTGGRDAAIVKLATGQPLTPLTEAEILTVADQFGSGNSVDGSPRSLGIVDIDQWTLQSARHNAPAWHIAFDDPTATEIYINGTTGEVFQFTNRRQRVLSWFGAIPHWTYPTILRQNGPLWTQVVIWSSILGTFLAATGLYVGISRLRRDRRSNKLGSPYAGWWYWHHITGLVFGVLVLTWVFSGLMTMNPWGALSESGGGDYRAQITGSARWGELKQLLRAIGGDANGNRVLADDARQITPAVFNNELFLLAHNADGSQLRLNSNAQAAPLALSAIERAVDGLGTPMQSSGLLHQEDNYYYGHKRDVTLPVYRAVLDDDEQTRLYINPESGAVRTLGSTGRWSRWIRTGLHDLDFPVLRLRPIWDIVVVFLLLGVTLVCVTGTWMAMRRIRRDYLSLRG